MEVIYMVDLKKLQKEIYQNKVNKGFNVTDINKEFCLTYGEVAEVYEAWRKKKNELYLYKFLYFFQSLSKLVRTRGTFISTKNTF